MATEEAIDAATRVVKMAKDALAPLELAISDWPADFRAIIWKAVATRASLMASDAKSDD